MAHGMKKERKKPQQSNSTKFQMASHTNNNINNNIDNELDGALSKTFFSYHGLGILFIARAHTNVYTRNNYCYT